MKENILLKSKSIERNFKSLIPLSIKKNINKNNCKFTCREIDKNFWN